MRGIRPLMLVSILTIVSFRALAQDPYRDGSRTQFDSGHHWNPKSDPTQPILKSLGKFKPTYYWVALEKDDGLPRNKEVLDINGNVLVKVSEKFLASLKLEGTGRLLDGRLLNYHDRVVLADGKKEIRYRFCGPDAPYGYGYGDLKLIPFRSLAVDTTVIPLGTRIYVPAAKGARLPDGTIHDGIFYALDIGDAIQNKRIDVFTSFGDQSKVFRDVGLDNMVATEIFMIVDPPAPPTTP